MWLPRYLPHEHKIKMAEKETRKNSNTQLVTPTEESSSRLLRQSSIPDSAERKELTVFSPVSMDVEEYKPSISDKTRVGFFSQDRATQTPITEILKVKGITEILQKLVKDVTNLKRSIQYAKHVLQADYENKLQERALDLYCRVNDRLLELEKLHGEQINVVRRSYRQQLSDSIGQIAKQHEAFYSKKYEQQRSKFEGKLKKAKDDEDYKSKAEQQQNSVIEMMKMQMREAQTRADAQLKEALERAKSPSSVATDPEIYELKDEVEKLENKVEDLSLELEDKENENRRLVSDVKDLNEQLDQERTRINQLKKELADAVMAAEQERMQSKASLERQRIELQNQMEARIQETRNDMVSFQKRCMEDLKRQHTQKLKEQSEMEKKRLEESLAAQTLALSHHPEDTRTLRRTEKPELSESEKDELIKSLQKLEKKQRADVARLQKELDRTNKTWEMKVTILQQTLHALKDESFLRTSLQRQAVRLQYAAVAFASDGPVVIPTKKATPTTLRAALPQIKTKRDVIYQRLDDQVPDSPFSEDRPTPHPMENQQEREVESDAEEIEETEDFPQSTRDSRVSQRPDTSPIKTVRVGS